MIKNKDKTNHSKTFMNNAMRARILSKDEEKSLTTLWKTNQDPKALEKLILAYSKLVIKIASQFRHYGLSFSDLVQEGHIGLLLALDRFEQSRDLRFSTYARWWVRANIQEFVLKNWSIVKTGSSSAQKSLFFNLRRFKSSSFVQGNSFINYEERKKIARLLGINEKFVEERENHFLKKDSSLNVPLNSETEEEWQNFLVDDSICNPEDTVIKNDEIDKKIKWLKEAMSSLTDREKKIINKRHLSETPLTLENIGKELNISKERVRQVETQALNKLKLRIKNLMMDKENLINKNLCSFSN